MITENDCFFNVGPRCNALVLKGHCPANCSFYKTEHNFIESQNKARQLLKTKLLKTKIINIDGTDTMTTTSMED